MPFAAAAGNFRLYFVGPIGLTFGYADGHDRHAAGSWQDPPHEPGLHRRCLLNRTPTGRTGSRISRKSRRPARANPATTERRRGAVGRLVGPTYGADAEMPRTSPGQEANVAHKQGRSRPSGQPFPPSRCGEACRPDGAGRPRGADGAIHGKMLAVIASDWPRRDGRGMLGWCLTLDHLGCRVRCGHWKKEESCHGMQRWLKRF